MSEVLVAPSILSADFSKLGIEVQSVIDAGADWIHVDVMDGHFVPNITIGPDVVKSLRPITDVPLDVHLMIENPDKYLESFAKAGSDYLTVHIEALAEPGKTLKKIKDLGVKCGLSLKPATPIESIVDYLEQVDLVLVMTVNPGFSGQGFMSEPVSKIKKLAEIKKAKKLKFLIEVDGGINEKTRDICVNAGAEVLVAGNFVYKNNYENSIKILKGK